ncbi:MAG: glycosyltransferase [Planctomycetota bacterium]|jgi:glycosyltransferase involved in cell wall biosynthesis|nr:glycosyltransferase [Planctomycetota bacterium]MDP6762821.1 glycosyltransferase [Planctomycetota bacterium]MDP6990495.1 glycosyltransferase [Planctomycetota bacterium]
MRVAYLTNQYPRTSHTFVRREIAALEELGVEVERFAIRPAGEDLVDERDRAELGRTRVLLDRGVLGLAAGLALALVTRPAAAARAAAAAVAMGRRSERGVARHLAYLAEAALLVRALERSCASHLHAHFGTNSAAVARLCRLLGGPPYSFTVHGPEEFDAPHALSLPAKIADAAFVCAISSFGRSQLYRLVPRREWEKIVVVPMGVDEAFLDEALARPVPAAPRLVCVGRLCEQKGQLLLVDAVARVVAAGREVHLRLVGDGELRAAVEERIAHHGLRERVEVVGWADTERVREELLAARALVLPSFAEGLPVVLMEALALGRPVLSTFVAGIPELVRPGECGWLVPAGCVDSLSAALAEVLDASPEDLAALGTAGRRRVAERHHVRAGAHALRERFARGGGGADTTS